jgi:hypothetical protein
VAQIGASGDVSCVTNSSTRFICSSFRHDCRRVCNAVPKFLGKFHLQNSAAEERAKAERTPSPELLASYTAEDEVPFGPLATDVEMDDLIGK